MHVSICPINKSTYPSLQIRVTVLVDTFAYVRVHRAHEHMQETLMSVVCV